MTSSMPSVNRSFLLVVCSILLSCSHVLSQSTTWQQRMALPVKLADFPDNIVTFVERDYIGFEGFAQYAGTTSMALIELFRHGALIGSARGFGGTDGGVFIELNHPGGMCWGANTDYKSTPNVQAGDYVMITFPDDNYFSMIVPNIKVTSYVLEGSEVKVGGTIAPVANIPRNFVECRIINPAMKDEPTIARRDVRASRGALVPIDGYQSGIIFTGNTWLATFVFQTPAIASLVYNTVLGDNGPRAYAWVAEDVGANRKGMVIYEWGLPGGPGDVGCPARATLPPSAAPTTASPSAAPTTKPPTTVPSTTKSPTTVPTAAFSQAPTRASVVSRSARPTRAPVLPPTRRPTRTPRVPA